MPTNPPATEPAEVKPQQFRVPPYSGHPVGTQYTGKKGTVHEMYTIQDWVRRVTRIAAANKWDEEKTANCAQLMLQPGTPAGVWYSNFADKGWMEHWNPLQGKLLSEFAIYVNASDKVDILQSFQQKPTDLVPHYLNWIQVEYKKFVEDIVL